MFIANDGVSGEELWISDGTLVGTQQVKDLCAGSCNGDISNLFTFQNKIYFWKKVLNNSVMTSSQLWQTDGTSLGTTLVKDFSPLINVGAVQASDESYFFTLADDVAGTINRKLWRIRPSASLLPKLVTGQTGSMPEIIELLGQRLVFKDILPSGKPALLISK